MSARVVASSSPEATSLAVAALRAGRIVAVPTETVYGLAVVPDQNGLEALMAAKRRSVEKGVALLVDSIDQAASIAAFTPAATQLARAYWPGPLTLVLPQRPGAALPELLSGGRPTIGIRLPDHPVPRALARALGPLALSSANLSGEPDATDAQRVVATLSQSVALVIDDGPVRGGVPSTVVACPADGPWSVLRVGAISEAELRAVAGSVAN